MPEALSILTRSLPPILPDCDAVTNGWLQWPLGQFIADHGLDAPDAAMEAMIALTQRFSSEFAVRPFVEHRPDFIFAQLAALTTHPSPHVRRWCSEGIRPRLPWGKRLDALVEDPSPILPILDALKDDDELYVRRSVANNLNDIAKDHPELVVTRMRAWSQGASANRQWLIKHALRSLIKAGNPDALDLMGYKAPQSLKVTLHIRPTTIRIGEFVDLNIEIINRSTQNQRLLVDYVVHYLRQGDKHSAKVFKWSNVDLAAGERIVLTKRHAMKITSVRALYPGEHRIEAQINGQRLANASFELL